MLRFVVLLAVVLGSQVDHLLASKDGYLLIPSDVSSFENFGESAVISEDGQVVFGGSYDQSGPGKATLFWETSAGSMDWATNEVRMTGSSLRPGDMTQQFGWAMDINGPDIFISENKDGIVFVWSESSVGARDWTNEIILVNPEVPGGKFGESLDAQGLDLAVGSPTHSPNGAIFVLHESASGMKDWSASYTKLDGLAADSELGYKVVMDGTRILSGCRTLLSVYIFTESSLGAHDWTLDTTTLSPAYLGPYSADFGTFGWTHMDMHGRHVVVGSNDNHDNTLFNGRVDIFSESNDNANDWSDLTFTTLYNPDPPTSHGYFGCAFHTGVSIYGQDILAVAVDISVTATQRYGVLWWFHETAIGALDWADHAHAIFQPTRVSHDEFGYSFDITANHYVAGAWQDNDFGSASGSLWVDVCPYGFTGAWPNCVDIDECTSDPCENGGVCTDIGVFSYECDCTGLGFAGDKCNKDCYNGIAVGIDCNCTASGAKGKFCNTDIDDCMSSPCANMGTCTDNGPDFFPERAHQFNCSCPVQYVGELCADAACVSSPCLNGAKCVVPGFGEAEPFICNCTGTGFEGALCQTEVDECASSPCMNDGVCTDEHLGFQCACIDGWKNSDCSENIDDCASSPCLNDAVCKDKTATYTCNCADGYVGDHCESDIDDCLSLPCAGGSECVDNGTNVFYCKDLDDCASSPCDNDGICIDIGHNAFSCQCTGTSYGDLCESVLFDPCLSAPCDDGAECIADAADYKSFSCVHEGVTATWEDVECDIQAVNCDDLVAVEAYFINELVNSMGGSAADYDVQVTSNNSPDNPLLNIVIVYADPENQYSDDAAFVMAVEDADMNFMIRGGWTSSGIESGASTAQLQSLVILVTALVTAYNA